MLTLEIKNASMEAFFGSGEQDRTADLRVMNRVLGIKSSFTARICTFPNSVE